MWYGRGHRRLQWATVRGKHADASTHEFVSEEADPFGWQNGATGPLRGACGGCPVGNSDRTRGNSRESAGSPSQSQAEQILEKSGPEGARGRRGGGGLAPTMLRALV